MSCSVEMLKPVSAMVSVELSLAIVNILLKKALNGGMDRVIIVVCRQTVATIFLIPVACFWERSSWSKLSMSLICRMFLCALIGLTLTQYLFLVGLDYTSATVSCAFINLVPVFTFVLALPLRMEKVDIKSKKGKAKVVGAMLSVVGALTLSFYKGVEVVSPRSSVLDEEHRVRPERYAVGTAFLAAGCLAWSSWFIMQSRIGHYFPHQYSSTMIMSSFSSLQSAILCLVTDRDFSNWILRGEMEIVAVIFSGIVGSGVCYVVMSWCVKKRGPVFTAAFSPLIQIFAAILDVLLLHEEIYLGSILGSVVVIVGMYILLWGKCNKDGEEACDALPKRLDHESHPQEITI